MNRPGAARAAVTAGVCLTLVLGASTACSSEESSAPVASSSSTRTPPNAYEKQRQDGVQKLLDQLNAALVSGNRKQIDALVDPLASADFKRTLYQAQSSLSKPSPEAAPRGGQIQFKKFGYLVDQTDDAERQVSGELSVKLGDAGSSDSWVAPVKVDYALGGASNPGVDEPVISLPSILVFSRYDDDWKLLGGEELAPDPAADENTAKRPPELGPWVFGGLAAADVKTAGGTSAVLSYPGTDQTVKRVRAQLAPAVAAVSDFWGQDWARKAVVMVTGDEAEFAGFTRTAAGTTSGAAAATVFSKIDKASKTVVGQRIVMSPAAGELSDAGIAVVLRHELTHVASRLVTAESAPMWLTEGVPEYVGRRGTYQKLEQAAPGLAAQVAAGQVPSTLPSDSDFGVDGDKAQLAYQTAWSFAAFVADKFGEQKLKRMYIAAAQGRDSERVDALIHNALGEKKDALIADWGKWLREQAR